MEHVRTAISHECRASTSRKFCIVVKHKLLSYKCTAAGIYVEQLVLRAKIWLNILPLSILVKFPHGNMLFLQGSSPHLKSPASYGVPSSCLRPLPCSC